MRADARQRGMSLISVLVAVGLLGIFAMVFATLFQSQFKVIKTIEQRGEVEDLRNVVRNVFDCANTVAKIGLGAACPPGKVAAYGHSNKITPFLPAGGTGKKVGDYTVYATCTGTTVKTFQFYSVKGSTKPVALFAVPFSCPG